MHLVDLLNAEAEEIFHSLVTPSLVLFADSVRHYKLTTSFCRWRVIGTVVYGSINSIHHVQSLILFLVTQKLSTLMRRHSM